MNTFDPAAIRPKGQQGPQTSIEMGLVWTMTAVIVPVFALASFLPIFSLFAEDRSWRTAIPDLIFLGTGFLAIGGVYALAKFATAGGNSEPTDGVVRGSGLKLLGYATAWLIFYAVYRGVV